MVSAGNLHVNPVGWILVKCYAFFGDQLMHYSDPGHVQMSYQHMKNDLPLAAANSVACGCNWISDIHGQGYRDSTKIKAHAKTI